MVRVTEQLGTKLRLNEMQVGSELGRDLTDASLVK